ncbi:MAG: hypothetical protein AVDCRST_MAG14-1364, partial [uncultured Rubrobacteraceae bacterium]
GEAWLYQGHYPGRRERLGRVTALLKLPATPIQATGTPHTLLRIATEGAGPPRPGPLPGLFERSGKSRMALCRRALPDAGGAFATVAALAPPRRSLPPRRMGRAVWVCRHLAHARLPVRLSVAAHGGAGGSVGRVSLRRGRVARGRARGGQGDQLRPGLPLLPRRYRPPPLRRLPDPARL